MKRWDIFLLVLGAFACMFVLVWLWGRMNECEAAGGRLVRHAVIGFECVLGREVTK